MIAACIPCHSRGEGSVLVPGAESRMPAPEPDGAARSWLAETERALDSPVSLEFGDAELRYAFDTLSRVSGINVILDHEVGSTPTLSVRLKGLPLRNMLSTICRASVLDFALVDHAVFVGSPEAVAEVTGEKSGIE